MKKKAPTIAPRRALGRVSAGFALALILLSSRVQAEPPPVWKWGRIDLRRVAGLELVYTRGLGTERLCSDEQTFRKAVAVNFEGSDAFEPAQPDEATIPMPLKRLEVSIARRKAEVIATMEWFGEGKSLLYRYEFTQPITECDRLFQTMVSSATISLTLAKTPLPDLPAAPTPASAHRPAPRRAKAPAASDAAPRRPLFQVGAAPLLAFEITPGLATGVALDTAVRWPSVSLGLEGRLLISPSTNAAGVDGVDIDTALAAITVVPCFHVGWFFGCGLLELGAIRFTGGDDVHPQTRDPFLAAGGLRAGIEWPFASRFALRGFADGASAFTRTTLVYNEMDRWTTPLVFGDVGLGLTAAF